MRYERCIEPVAANCGRLLLPTPRRLRVFVAISAAALLSCDGPTEPRGAARLELSIRPSASARNRVPLEQHPAVQLVDIKGRPVERGAVEIRASILAGDGSLGGTTAVGTSASGLAVFRDLQLAGTVGLYALEFSAAGLGSVVATIRLDAGAPTGMTATGPDTMSAIVGTAIARFTAPRPPTL